MVPTLRLLYRSSSNNKLQTMLQPQGFHLGANALRDILSLVKQMEGFDGRGLISSNRIHIIQLLTSI